MFCFLFLVVCGPALVSLTRRVLKTQSHNIVRATDYYVAHHVGNNVTCVNTLFPSKLFV
jgi:hypothetical protein